MFEEDNYNFIYIYLSLSLIYKVTEWIFLFAGISTTEGLLCAKHVSFIVSIFCHEVGTVTSLSDE